MSYITRLLPFSNNERLFKEELDKIKIELENSPSVYKDIKKFAKDLNTYCNKYTEAKKDRYVNVLPIDNYCMFVLNNNLNVLNKDLNIKLEVVKERLGYKSVPSYIKDMQKDEYVSVMLEVMNLFSTNQNDLEFNNLTNTLFFEEFEIFMSCFNFKIINDLTDVKPTVYIGKTVTDTVDLGLFSLMVSTHIILPNIISITNKFVSDCMYKLLYLILDETDKEYLLSKYKCENINELDTLLGKEIANCILRDKTTEVVEELLELKKQRETLEYQVYKATKIFNQNNSLC